MRLVGERPDGTTSTGTGFFYRTEAHDQRWIPSIITNKHVLRDVETLTFSVSLMSPSREPIVGRYHTQRVTGLQPAIIHHPSADIDLCAVSCAGLVALVEQTGFGLYLKYFERQHIPNPADEDDFGALEPILMVGYPNGLWDDVHNRPLFRRGVTSTHPAVDLNGKGEFLIDAACFAGSSGSPVILWREPGRIDRFGNIDMSGIKPKLLGVLWGGPIATAEGSIVVVPVPTGMVPIAQTGIPMNLGYVVKARYLLDLEPLIVAQAKVA